MQDKLLAATKVKKIIEYIEKTTNNYPNIEYILKNKIIDKLYELLDSHIRQIFIKIHCIWKK